jgi:farnesyl-diphosphate farnesyltransferase
MKDIAMSTVGTADQLRQRQLLPGVSRTFALTIPQLPEPLREVVTNAYLLCRIADTIEDDAALSPTQKANFHQQFRAVVAAQASASAFAETLYPLLATSTPSAERELIQQIPAVIRCLRGFTAVQQASLRRCIDTMSTGMPDFQRTASLQGLEDQAEMDRYCYYVAGVVGEMLTELFCEYSPQIAGKRQELMSLAVSFGQSLQMTNILKDFWEDRQRGVCWLPRDIFHGQGLDLAAYSQGQSLPEFTKALHQLIRISCRHLQNAMRYTLLIPPSETGIRRFSLWAIGLAALTLRNIYRTPQFISGAQVKVNRRALKLTILTANLSCRYNSVLNFLFKRLIRELA